MTISSEILLGSAGAKRSVRYEVECHTDVWCLMANDREGRKYLICAYEDQQVAEQALAHLQEKAVRK